MSKIRIDSDGTTKGTFVCVDDQRLDHVQKLVIYMNASTGLSNCTLTLLKVPIKLHGSMDVRKKEVG